MLESSGTKLKPYLIQAVQTLGISFDDYSKVVASICQETSGDVEQNEERGAGIDMVILSLVSRWINLQFLLSATDLNGLYWAHKIFVTLSATDLNG